MVRNLNSTHIIMTWRISNTQHHFRCTEVAVWFQNDGNREKEERANLAAFSHNQKVSTRDIFNSLVKKRTICMKSIVISCPNSTDWSILIKSNSPNFIDLSIEKSIAMFIDWLLRDILFRKKTRPRFLEKVKKLRPLPEPIRLRDLQTSGRSRRVCFSGEGRRYNVEGGGQLVEGSKNLLIIRENHFWTNYLCTSQRRIQIINPTTVLQSLHLKGSPFPQCLAAWTTLNIDI